MFAPIHMCSCVWVLQWTNFDYHVRRCVLYQCQSIIEKDIAAIIKRNFTYAYSVDVSTISQYQLCTPAYHPMCDDKQQMFNWIFLLAKICIFKNNVQICNETHTQGFMPFINHFTYIVWLHTRKITYRWEYANKILKTDFFLICFVLFRLL